MADFREWAKTILQQLGIQIASQANNWNSQRKAGLIPASPTNFARQLREWMDRVRPDTTATAQAQGLVSKAFNDSRNEVLAEIPDSDIAFWSYSALLDRNTCSVCGSDDGRQAQSEDDLPPVPNPNCEGGPRCRCIHVAVLTSEVEARS